MRFSKKLIDTIIEETPIGYHGLTVNQLCIRKNATSKKVGYMRPYGANWQYNVYMIGNEFIVERFGEIL